MRLKYNIELNCNNSFYILDYNGMARLFETVRQVRIAVADTQETKKKFGYVHCNADQIKQGTN